MLISLSALKCSQQKDAGNVILLKLMDTWPWFPGTFFESNISMRPGSTIQNPLMVTSGRVVKKVALRVSDLENRSLPAGKRKVEASWAYEIECRDARTKVRTKAWLIMMVG